MKANNRYSCKKVKVRSGLIERRIVRELQKLNFVDEKRMDSEGLEIEEKKRVKNAVGLIADKLDF